MKKLLFTFLFLIGFHIGFSQTAVYMCTSTGAVGYAYGTYNVKNIAYSNCIDAGGYSPFLVTYNPSKGYGSLAVGVDIDGLRVIGVASGYDDLQDAIVAARLTAIKNGGINVYTQDTWSDF
jgi:hypothetical protein